MRKRSITRPHPHPMPLPYAHLPYLLDSFSQTPPMAITSHQHKRIPHAKLPDWSLEHYTPIHVTYSKNPMFELCPLDFKSYYEAPHAYPMFKDLVLKSKCKTKKKSYSALMEEIELNQGTPAGRVVPPTGFIFHESRVGSTLVANMLASNPWAMVWISCFSFPFHPSSLPPSQVFSESNTGHEALRSCPACSREDNILYFQQVVTMMGRSPVHEMLFFKFQSSTVTSISIALEV